MIQICLLFSLTICCVVWIIIKIILANKRLWALREGGALWRSAWLQVGIWFVQLLSDPEDPSPLLRLQKVDRQTGCLWGSWLFCFTFNASWVLRGKKHKTRQFTVWKCGSEKREKIRSAPSLFSPAPLGDVKLRKGGEGCESLEQWIGMWPNMSPPLAKHSVRIPLTLGGEGEADDCIRRPDPSLMLSLSLGNVSIYQISFCFLMKL